MVKRKAFLANSKHQYQVSQCGEHDCSAQSQKEWRLLWEFDFDTFHGWTLILRKMVEWKAYLANPKHQYGVSQYGEHDCSAQTPKECGLLRESKFGSVMDKLWL